MLKEYVFRTPSYILGKNLFPSVWTLNCLCYDCWELLKAKKEPFLTYFTLNELEILTGAIIIIYIIILFKLLFWM